MKLLRIKPFMQPENKIRSTLVKPIPCVHCGKDATREAVYRGSGVKFVRKYCDRCKPEKTVLS